MTRDLYSQLRSRIRVAGGLPVFSDSLQQVLELIRKPDTTMPMLARAIERDPALSARILKLANSAYYGLSEKVASLNLALVLLGLRNIQTVAHSIGFLDILKEFDDSGDYPGLEFREHCVLSGRIASSLAQLHQKGEGAEEFVAGLIHDIGKLVLYRAYDELVPIAAHKVREEGRLGPGAEREIFGLSHCEAGAWAVREWKLPPAIAEAIANHHAEERDLSALSERGQELTLLLDAADKASHWVYAHIMEDPEKLPEEWQSDPWLGHPKLTPEFLFSHSTEEQV